jgi:hypothetical protein
MDMPQLARLGAVEACPFSPDVSTKNSIAARNQFGVTPGGSHSTSSLLGFL